MDRPPRPAGEPVITATMWRGIVFVGVIMAVATLFVLDASLPGGFVDGGGAGDQALLTLSAGSVERLSRNSGGRGL